LSRPAKLKRVTAQMEAVENQMQVYHRPQLTDLGVSQLKGAVHPVPLSPLVDHPLRNLGLFRCPNLQTYLIGRSGTRF
jgi:hypothetical protein